METEVAAGAAGVHIVVFPWLAFGHMLPYLELSKSLARRGHLVSFITTPRNVQRLPKVPTEVAHLLRMVALPLPRVDGMPDAAEATSDLPTADEHRLRKASDGLQGPFAAFLNEPNSHPCKPDWIIHDFAHHWMPTVAAGVPCVFFSIFSAACLAFVGPPSMMGCRKGLDDYTVSPPWVPFPSKVAYRRHEIMSIGAQVKPSHDDDNEDSGASDIQRMQMSMESSEIVAVRTCAELEPEWLPLLEQVYPNTVVAVGLLPPVAAERSRDGDSEIMGWLDKQTRKSVVYVALGSEVTVSVELLQELALGLEASGLPFLWALRRPSGVADDVEILPRGFEERCVRGKVVMGWAPQMKILAHTSVGGFLTHCGWGSIVESLQFGHPMVLLPVFGDQGLNARMLEERGIGIEVERDEEDGSFTRNEVEKALKLIMVDEEGCAYRKRAEEVKEAVADKDRQEKYVDGFIRLLLGRTSTKLRV